MSRICEKFLNLKNSLKVYIFLYFGLVLNLLIIFLNFFSYFFNITFIVNKFLSRSPKCSVAFSETTLLINKEFSTFKNFIFTFFFDLRSGKTLQNFQNNISSFYLTLKQYIFSSFYFSFQILSSFYFYFFSFPFLNDLRNFLLLSFLFFSFFQFFFFLVLFQFSLVFIIFKFLFFSFFNIFCPVFFFFFSSGLNFKFKLLFKICVFSLEVFRLLWFEFFYFVCVRYPKIGGGFLQFFGVKVKKCYEVFSEETLRTIWDILLILFT